MKKIISLLLTIALAVNLSAQKEWTLRECIDYAIANNIEIKQQELQVEGAKIDLNTSKMSRLPNLNASSGANFNFGQSTIAGTNMYESANSFNTNFGVSTSMPIFTGFKIPNEVKAKEFSLLSATANLEKARENMELQVTSLYLEVLFKKEILKVYEEQLTLTTSQLEKTRAMVEAGKVPRSQEYDMISQQAKDELNVTTAKNDMILSLLNLSQALNLDEYESFDIEEPAIGKDQIDKNLKSLVSPREIYRIAIGVKPHVKVAEYNLEKDKKMLNVSKANYYPTLSLNAGFSTRYGKLYGERSVYDEENDTYLKIPYNNEGFGSQFKNNASEYIGVTLSIPIFNRFATRNSVRTAKLSISDSQLALDNVKLALFKEIQQAYQSATAAQAKYSSTEKSLIAAEEAYKYAQDRYELGKSSVYEFNEAQTKLLTSKSEQIQAKYDFLFRTKILDFYRGEQIDIQ